MKTHLTLLLDESASMQSIKAQTVSSFNEYMSTIPEDVDFRLLRFSSHGWEGKTIRSSKSRKLRNYTPSGGTPLYDAVAESILRAEATPADRYLIVILTDGEENQSREWSDRQVQKMVKAKTKSGRWTFVFLGANQNAWAASSKLGVGAGNTMVWAATPVGVTSTSSSLGSMTRTYLASSSTTSNSTFTDAGQSKKDYK